MNYEILCGIHSVLEGLKAKRRSFSRIYISKERTLARLNEIIELAQTDRIEVDFVSSGHLDQLSNGVKHQGIAAKTTQFFLKRAEDELKDIEQDGQTKFIMVLEGIEDTHNLGAIIRTALCAGVEHIVIPKDRAVQPSPAVSRVSAGAMEHADIRSVTNTVSYLRNLKKKGFWVAGLDAQGDTPLFKADLTGSIALVVGGEHQGIRPLVKKECDFLLSLPLAQGVTSLNASVASAVAMYEVVRQRSRLD